MEPEIIDISARACENGSGDYSVAIIVVAICIAIMWWQWLKRKYPIE